MLTITDTAGGYLNEVLERSNTPPSAAVRLVVGPSGLSAAIDEERPGDATFNHGNRKVLVLDEQASSALSGRTLDAEQTPDGPRLSVL